MRHQTASTGKMLHHNGILAADVWLGKEAEPWEETDDFSLAVKAIEQEAEETQESLPIEWAAGIPVEKDETVIHDGTEYTVIQPHITQINWTPNIVPALYKKKTQPAEDWEQPTGAHDAYCFGDTATHKGQLWSSTAANNVWEPGVYGWELVSETPQTDYFGYKL